MFWCTQKIICSVRGLIVLTPRELAINWHIFHKASRILHHIGSYTVGTNDDILWMISCPPHIEHVACTFPGFIHEPPTLCRSLQTVTYCLVFKNNSINRNSLHWIVLALSQDGVRTDFLKTSTWIAWRETYQLILLFQPISFLIGQYL